MPDVIRGASADDEPAIRALVDAAYTKYVARIGKRPLPMDDDYTVRIANEEAYVLVDENEVVGVIVLLDDDDRLLIDNVAVAPAAQGRGLGRRLLAFAEDEARRRGVTELLLYTNEKMTENRAIYARLGYVEDAKLEIAGRHAIRMRKRL